MAEELASRPLDMPKREMRAPSTSLAEPPAEKTVSLHVKDAPAADVLKGLAEMTGENVILSSHVKERVTASLDDVTPEEAMTSIMAACGLAGRKEGSTLIIFSAVTEKESGIFAKSYRLSYANAKEAAESLTDMVSKGKVSYKPVGQYRACEWDACRADAGGVAPSGHGYSRKAGQGGGRSHRSQ